MPQPKLGVLASGGGSNLQALIDAHTRGDLPAPVRVVISNNSRAGCLRRAEAAGIPGLHISSKTHPEVGPALVAALQEHDVDLVVLAGYLKLIGPELLQAFPGRVLNIHPGPLPAFGGQGMYGQRVHEAVLRAQAKLSGPTIFVVTERYDEGPILAHTPVPVEANDDADSLAARVLKAEHELYWRVIRDHFCGGPESTEP